MAKTFNADVALARYRELNDLQDEIFRKMMALEREAKEHGFMLGVAPDSTFRAEDTCEIRPMTQEEREQFLQFLAAEKKPQLQA